MHTEPEAARWHMVKHQTGVMISVWPVLRRNATLRRTRSHVTAIQRVIVVGAGIGGLVLTRALVRLGVAVDLVELSAAPRALGAGITLGANAMRILSELGVGDDVARRGCPITLGAITDGAGRVLSSASLNEVEARYGRSIAIARSELHGALCHGLWGDDSGLVRTRFGTTVKQLDVTASGVDIELESGQHLQAAALIGADGIRSHVRKLAFGSLEPGYAGYTCWRFAGRVPGGLSQAVEMWGAGQRVGLVPLRGDDEVYTFFVDNAPRGTPSDPARRTAAFLRSRFASFAGDVPRVLAALGDDSAELLHHDIEEVSLPSWVRGPVALLGDAAHAMTPNMGQGAAMAIEDAYVLARELAAHDAASTALVAYEARRRPRVTDIQARSRSLGQVAQWQSSAAVWARNRALRWAPDSATQKAIERVVAYMP